MPLNILTSPMRLSGKVIRLSILSKRIFAIRLEVVAISKSSTCRLKRTRSPSTIPEYNHGSWTVGLRPRSWIILSAYFSHSHGDLGCPCVATRTGMTSYPLGTGGRSLQLIHQWLKALSGRMKNPCFCGGASPKALETSAP